MAVFPKLTRTRTWPGLQPLGPTMKRGKSDQVVGTPWELVSAVERTWGGLDWDLAANASNTKAIAWLGPGSLYNEDSFTEQWSKLDQYMLLSRDPLLWLNHEWDNSSPWVKKCAEEMILGARIINLSRAATDANWWWEWVAPYAVSYTLKPRLQFVGAADQYPSPLAINLFGVEDRLPGLAGRWNWVTGEFDRRVNE